MDKIKKILGLIILISFICVGPASAAISLDLNDFYNPMSIISVVVLFIAVACLVWSLKILTLVKGGLMSKSWQMFGLGFGFLIVAQLVSLGQVAQLFVIPDFITPAVYLLMVITWLYGLYQTRKVLG